jgi:nitrate reductase gamma subunit
MKRETAKALGWSVLITGLLAVMVVVGSRNLTRFDPALAAYTLATLFAAGGITYRSVLWLQRPPTALYWQRSWQMLARPALVARHLITLVQRVIGEFALNSFIYARKPSRWLTQWVLMMGCALAIAITFPLVYGWLSFSSTPENISIYRAVLFGFPTAIFPADSLLGFLAFHGLDISAVLVIAGVFLALRRRMRDESVIAVQLFIEDFLPLILFFAVSVSGLMLTVSYTWLDAAGYGFLKLFHAFLVIFTLLYVPFSKLFHIFQRPLQLGVELYQDVAVREQPARCRRCGHAFAPQIHIADLIETERALGYHYESADRNVEHYQWICPRCRRALLALAQGRLTRGGALTPARLPAPMPTYANPGLGQGPLSREDRDNFHP